MSIKLLKYFAIDMLSSIDSSQCFLVHYVYELG
jgi:hypothetical protein